MTSKGLKCSSCKQDEPSVLVICLQPGATHVVRSGFVLILQARMKRISAHHTKPVAPFPHWCTTDVKLLDVTEKCLSFCKRSCAPVAAA